MERMFNLDPQLIQDVVITAVNIFILFLAGSYLMFNPVRNFLNKRKEGIADDIEKAKTDMHDAFCSNVWTGICNVNSTYP